MKKLPILFVLILVVADMVRDWTGSDEVELSEDSKSPARAIDPKAKRGLKSNLGLRTARPWPPSTPPARYGYRTRKARF